MAAQPQPIPKFAPTVVAPNGHLLPLAEVPTPGPSPHNSTHMGPPPNKDKDLPPTPPTSNTGRSSPTFPATTTMTPITAGPINPFETDPSRLPLDDPFRDLPHYGRYAPSPADFQPCASHILSTKPASIRYWEDVLTTHCNADTLMLSPVDDAEPDNNTSSSSVALGRWIFAVGGCIIKTNHLAPPTRRRRDYSRVDANEVAALALVRKHVVDAGGSEAEGVRVPRVYFAGRLLGGDVLVQERLPGVSLEVAWRYLDAGAKKALRGRQKVKSFAGARAGIGWGNGGGVSAAAPGKRKDSGLDDGDDDYASSSPRLNSHTRNTTVFLDDDDDPDPDTTTPYSLDHPDRDTRFAHNDLSTSNIIIVDGGDPATGRPSVVGIVDWEHAGWIGWRTTAAVHRELRAPLPDMYDRDEFGSEAEWRDFFMWKGLYDDDDGGEDRY
ncbi:COMPASS (complex proteins associated with Set1p) component [Diplodia intermedia]|uniref:COMPASS (Complex proteins associated with Set1p) component n=1 Tax=Diplodia intermedia TaxID=856260 RepID=A0ABR3TKP4_9PEZI